MDKNDTFRKQLGAPYYFYSYSFTSYDLDSDGSNRKGLTSIFNNSAHLFKESSIRRPTSKIMIAEEVAALTPLDSPPGNQSIINDGRWVPDSDYLTVRHSGKADVSFADGHAQIVTWKIGLDPINSQGDLNGP
jgi:prepilin-type processing-associated H-X9-DG protein